MYNSQATEEPLKQLCSRTINKWLNCWKNNNIDNFVIRDYEQDKQNQIYIIVVEIMDRQDRQTQLRNNRY